MGKKWKRILKLRRVRAARLGATETTEGAVEATTTATQEVIKAPPVEAKPVIKAPPVEAKPAVKAPTVEVKETVEVTKKTPTPKLKKTTTAKNEKNNQNCYQTYNQKVNTEHRRPSECPPT
jgi:hypothetical protein